MAYKKWIIRNADKDKASQLSEKFNMDPFIAYLLVSRGLGDALSAGTFIGDSFVSVSPFNFADMEEAAFTVGDAIDMGEKICIYGDYDCDGVTSTALLYSFLKDEGADVFYYIPSREGEGYGLNKDAIKNLKEQGTDLIVTVDNGISSFDEAEYIYSLGMRLVVTDHHQLGDRLPMAEAVVNPYREENSLSFRDYCGVGVAFKLACAMYSGDINDIASKYIDLVAIGTIADVVPLLDENRAFVKAGLDLINNSPRPSIAAFKSVTSPYDINKQFSANDIAFQLCPRINAMGRMDDAYKAVEFLIEEDSEQCKFRLEQLNCENSHRQETEKQILEDVERKLSDNPKLLNERVIVASGMGYHNGVVGIVASHIVEKYGKPAFVIGIDEEGVARGSARSVEGFNIYEAISYCQNDLIRFGGHPLAAGVTLKKENIELFTKHINEYAFKTFDIMPSASLTLDCKISPDYLSLDLVDNLKIMEPFGASNPQPVFGVFGMTVIDVTPLKEGRHIRLELDKKGRRIKVVKFSTPYDEFPYKAGDKVNVAVRVSKNMYKERNYLSIQAVDIHLSSVDDEKYFKEKNDYESFRLTKRGSKALYPTREVCSVIYKYLRANDGYRFSTDELYFRLQDRVNYSQLVFALSAFSQAGLISQDDGVKLLPADKKVNLENTKTLAYLRERLNLG